MEEKVYTTGEIAKLCNVSVRTVQYYDKEKIVQPSENSTGGRRIYTEEDLEKFKLVCLYKTLGFSLKEIRNILNSENEYTIVYDLLDKKQDKLEENIKEKIKLKNKITTIMEDIKLNGSIEISNNDELRELIAKIEHHKKISRKTYLLLTFYVVIVILSYILNFFVEGLYMFIIIFVDIVLLLALIYFHSSKNAYICPNCKKKFTITFLKDALSLNNGKKGKYLKCPYCNQKSWIAETYRDDY
ncbi:MerR family transcriptional regulator [Miniphocaeibacter massiliensis]|uniref:MerR family transcriptional regulator n=1 Tax=Miniphocaeibacter massiliensis TaxID=2041841 RepID=UPI000C1C6515|nr:MerR family transcriptional regulator [Miniphocaeibacter massiliensis]